MGGWLALFVLGLIAFLSRQAYGIASITAWVSGQPFSGPANFDRLPPAMRQLVIGELICGIGLFVFGVLVAIALLRRHASAPRLVVTLILLHVAVAVGDALWIGVGMDTGSMNVAGRAVLKAAVTAVGAAILVPYFMRSVRVRNTFRPVPIRMPGRE